MKPLQWLHRLRDMFCLTQYHCAVLITRTSTYVAVGRTSGEFGIALLVMAQEVGDQPAIDFSVTRVRAATAGCAREQALQLQRAQVYAH